MMSNWRDRKRNFLLFNISAVFRWTDPKENVHSYHQSERATS